MKKFIDAKIFFFYKNAGWKKFKIIFGACLYHKFPPIEIKEPDSD